VLHLYGITDAIELLEPGPLGLEGQAVEMVRFEGMAAITSQVQDGPEASEHHLREHFRAVEAFAAGNTVLPVRFGTAFAGLTELQTQLERSRDVYSSDLRRLHGQIEVSIRAAKRSEPARLSGGAENFITDSGPGSRYLAEKCFLAAQRLASQREADNLAGFLIERLAPGAAHVKWRALETPSDTAGVFMAFLLPRESLKAFQDVAAALRVSEPGLDFLFTGPWPPYSFVSATDAAGALSGIS